MQKPVRSRRGLTRCPRCRAHVSAGDKPSEVVCPFCESTAPRSRSRILSATGGRAGVLAASLLAFSAAGCGGTQNDGSSTAVDNQNTDDPSADDPSADDTYAEDPAPDPVAVEEYGMPPDAEDEYENEPAPDPAPAARYGLPPGRY